MSIEHERESLYQMLGHLNDRVTDLQGAIESRPAPFLTDEEHSEHHRWIEIAIRRESQSYEFRRAVITKSTSALLWSAIVAAAGFAWTAVQTYAQNHGWKP